jgi:hypothetical protein
VSTEASFCAKIVISSAKHAALSSAAVPGMGTPRKRRDCEMLRMKGSMAILKRSGERPQPCRTLRVILKVTVKKPLTRKCNFRPGHSRMTRKKKQFPIRSIDVGLIIFQL